MRSNNNNRLSFSDKVSTQQIATALSQISIKDTSLSDTCPTNPTCSANTLGSPFRTLDGSCNNIINSIWGRSGTQYLRLLEADYNDRNIILNATVN